MPAVNNVTRMLDSKKIPYTPYEVPAVKMSALEVAEFLQLPPKKVFKTIVLRREKKGKPILAIIPATGEVSTKKLARFINEKKVSVAKMQDAEKITGLLTGGISPLALINKGFQAILDTSALDLKEIYISGGQRGLQIQLSPEDLITLTTAKIAPISQ
ncbi:MAG: aminoacyl-tRNA deacylase [Anaerolineaceae bacterium]|nr:aminoacyl-tRNA deacylase [Anaerolineaceae bacterium]